MRQVVAQIVERTIVHAVAWSSVGVLAWWWLTVLYEGGWQ